MVLFHLILPQLEFSSRYAQCIYNRQLEHDPLNKHFWKFRSKTECRVGSVQPEKLKKIGPPLKAEYFSRLDRCDRNGPFHFTPFSISVPRCSVFSMSKMEENTYHCSLYGSLTADKDLSVLPCTIHVQ